MGQFEHFEPVTIGMPIEEDERILQKTFRSLNDVMFLEPKLDLIVVSSNTHDYSVLTNFDVIEIIEDCTEAEARNIILERCKTDYLIMIDSDVIFDIKTFDILRKLIKKDDNIVSLCAQQISLYESSISTKCLNEYPIDFSSSHNELSCIIIDIRKLKSLLDIKESMWYDNDFCTCTQLRNKIIEKGYKSGKTNMVSVLNTRGIYIW